MNKIVFDKVFEAPLADTHEHLLEESTRLNGALHPLHFQCDDWSYLFLHYLRDDLIGAGMTDSEYLAFESPDTPPDRKYDVVAPYWNIAKHTGYAQAVRYTLKGLYGEDDLTRDSAHRLAQKYRDLVKPGFYRKIIGEMAGVPFCHVNSHEAIFLQTEQPGFLLQDLSILEFSRCSLVDVETVEKETGRRPRTLGDWLEIIDGYFETHGKSAVAVKSWAAYERKLDYGIVSQVQAEKLFHRHMNGQLVGLGPDDLKVLQDFLFRYCIGKAEQYDLPVKLHMGYYSGRNRMPLARLRANAEDICPILQDFPGVNFVLMHIGYPYQDEYIALAKHYTNVYIDMCWAWIINPAAGVRFLKELLTAAPANKVLTFGGDYVCAETVYGHSRIARKGIAQALSELVGQGWIVVEEIQPVVDLVTHGNALKLFPNTPAAIAGGR